MNIRIPDPPTPEWIEAAVRYADAETADDIRNASYPFIRAHQNPGRAASRILVSALRESKELVFIHATEKLVREREEKTTHPLIFLLCFLVSMLGLFSVVRAVAWLFGKGGAE